MTSQSNSDNAPLINRFRLIVVGCIFHTGGRYMEAFLAFMPSAGIWDVEGRVRGFDLENGRFHFNFESEENLQKVLKKRPCHFNLWTFFLERWELNFQEDLLCFVNFWVKKTDLPLRCWVEEAFRGIGNALGLVSEVGVMEARMMVAMNVTKPLKFKKRVLIDNGEEVLVTISYEKLFLFCFTYHLISHEEHEEKALVGRRERDQRVESRNYEVRRSAGRDSGLKSGLDAPRITTVQSSQSEKPLANRSVRKNLYLSKEAPRNEPSLEHWRSSRRPPRHHSNRFIVDLAALPAKDKGKQKMTEVENDPMNRNEDDDMEITNLILMNSVLDLRLSDPMKSYSTNLFPPPQAEKSTPISFEATPHETELPVTMVDVTSQDIDGVPNWMEDDDGLADWVEDDNGLSDWAEEDNLDMIADENQVIQCTQGGDSIPSDWENLAEAYVELEKELTEEDFRLIKELENQMIFDGLLDNDDLLREEMMGGEPEGRIEADDSQESTISK
ncbi:unnamed protein product [Arabidopsis arenosa]|uniref:DUF4283 domain-containing protein n=1 Tax=Arabidopsis arenosa TaxID=38785 RepID=A0A8S2B354_ARAAE|nr:unnamed protein product [Arabidopsis arenosa]